jgi:hypothetical protein
MAVELKISKSVVPKVVKDVRQLMAAGRTPETKQLREAVDAMELIRQRLSPHR